LPSDRQTGDATPFGETRTSTVKKSVPASTARWARMNAAELVVCFLSGAGATPWRFRMLPTV
jgi:hypothetical protein